MNVITWEKPADEEVRRAANDATEVEYGAQSFAWFGRIADSLREGVAYRMDDGPAGHWLSDMVHEVCDGAVPIYTWDRWTLFHDVCGWAYSEETAYDFGPLPADMTEAAGVVLYVVATLFAWEFLRLDGWAEG